MKIGLIGLGKMGYNIALNLKSKQIDVIAYDISLEARSKIKQDGVKVADTYQDLVNQLPIPKIIWLMVPSGKIVETVIEEVSTLLQKGDILIDGGNSNYNDTLRRYHSLSEKGIHFVDCGTSGGTDGARYGASLMVGGDTLVVASISTLFESIAKKDGYAYLGTTGSGHFAKMVHNGIEYGMMQAIGEGFDLLEASEFNYDYESLSRVWANGSIIEGLLMNTVHSAFSKDNHLTSIEGIIDDSGEGQWTIEEAMKRKVAVPVISQALFARYKSKDQTHFSEKVVAAMRNEFGGHKVYKK
ncbi:MAG: decarboxylating 6-phosphogluconate dehydrogenase [Candidatus Izemoplasmatales bacterium]|nr:decarboxylating 6-phosphogluconate dehydrogenase [Candidatus Izemoplasmatales bacterium]